MGLYGRSQKSAGSLTGGSRDSRRSLRSPLNLIPPGRLNPKRDEIPLSPEERGIIMVSGSRQHKLTGRSPVLKIIKIPIAILSSTPIYNKGH
ncbi:hypothetical protein [Laspinema olomoucense]|uniref:hypothetical protein n=1 Tax=Laspinema olomoucense TaxID=3231600 RepID=UPI0021BA5166|nr:hypothetical protein [Laspinema sp. D3c]MCT7995770.1 hypothetical protein [Laspinema sp. D3c]